jgi:carbonic anhydrase/acetyltransferase-like protein (isoleucine patch superfamily)
VWYGCVLRADGGSITVGGRSNVQDGCLVGMGAVVLTGARIGRGSLVAAGAVVREGALIPPGSLVAGVPAQVRRPLTDQEAVRVRENAQSYLDLLVLHRGARGDEAPDPRDAR